MLDKLFLNNKKNVYLFALSAILIESFSSVCLKYASKYEMFSGRYLMFFAGAVMIMAIYAVMWQIILEYLPLTTAYMRKGVTYILVYIWAYVFFGEKISFMQWIATVLIIVGMIISQMDEVTEK